MRKVNQFLLLGALVFFTIIFINGLTFSRTDSSDEPNWIVSGHLKPDDRAAFNTLVKAVIQVESDGRRKLIGPCRERGLMQIRRRTWNWTCRTQLKVKWDYRRWAFDPQKNTAVGRAYLLYLLKEMDYYWPAAVMSYNCGLTKYRKAKVPRMTYQYLAKIKKVLTNPLPSNTLVTSALKGRGSLN
ncbi:MAG: lytic transglycosylase domain-containing protein [Planctomycetes bacterium]|nr:lytic transglycosylase domain-containing protein [Planctomycetota bacterium]